MIIVRSVRICTCVLAVCIGPILASRAEDLLDKGGNKYLGWQVSKESFKRCDRSSIAIEGGKIRRTSDRCPEGGPFFRPYNVKVLGIDLDNRMIKAITTNKAERLIFYPKTAEDILVGRKLSDIKLGDEIQVHVPAAFKGEEKNWRANSIVPLHWAYDPGRKEKESPK